MHSCPLSPGYCCGEVLNFEKELTSANNYNNCVYLVFIHVYFPVLLDLLPVPRYSISKKICCKPFTCLPIFSS